MQRPIDEIVVVLWIGREAVAATVTDREQKVLEIQGNLFEELAVVIA